MSKFQNESFFVLLLTSLILGTFLRISLLFIYPILALLLVVFYKFRISKSLVVMMALIAISFALSLFPNLFLKYKFLSLFYMLPFILLLFSNPSVEKNRNIDHLGIFMKCLTIVALINNIFGFIQVFRNPGSDDSFTGIYGQFSVSMNGLMLLNTVIFFYYFANYIYKRKILNLLISLFFLTSAVLCFYGAGLIICMIAFVLSFFRMSIRSFLKTTVAGFISIVIIYFLMLSIKPLTLEYNISNIKKLASFDAAKGPRKITSFYNYFTSYPHNAKDFLFGSGPGTFNSRSAFMIGSPSYFVGAHFIKDVDQPYYFKNYAYTLWNESNTIQALYLDGFRNQPFSSILAFLGEYGFIFTATLFFLYFRYYTKIARLYNFHIGNPNAEIYFRFFKFLIILLPLLLLLDNYFEHPEIMLLILLGLKLTQMNFIPKIQKDIADEA